MASNVSPRLVALHTDGRIAVCLDTMLVLLEPNDHNAFEVCQHLPLGPLQRPYVDESRLRFVESDLLLFTSRRQILRFHAPKGGPIKEKDALDLWSHDVSRLCPTDFEISHYLLPNGSTEKRIIFLFRNRFGAYSYPNLKPRMLSNTSHFSFSEPTNMTKHLSCESFEMLSMCNDGFFVNANTHILALIKPLPKTILDFADGEYMDVADNVAPSSSFCCSSTYGTFYINATGDAIMHSPIYDAQHVQIVATLSAHARCVRYDEAFGISGRLLAICDGFSMYQWVNLRELELLKLALQNSDELVRDPKTIRVVYEMLYGDAFVRAFCNAHAPPSNRTLQQHEDDDCKLREQEEARLADQKKERQRAEPAEDEVHQTGLEDQHRRLEDERQLIADEQRALCDEILSQVNAIMCSVMEARCGQSKRSRQERDRDTQECKRLAHRVVEVLLENADCAKLRYMMQNETLSLIVFAWEKAPSLHKEPLLLEWLQN